MKKLFALIALCVSTAAFADNICEVTAFGTVFQGTGRSENAAKVDARIKCVQAGNNQMFCTMDKMTCQDAFVQPTAYCEIASISGLSYEIRGTQQEAAAAVRQDCLNKDNAIFCTPDKIKCLDL